MWTHEVIMLGWPLCSFGRWIAHHLQCNISVYFHVTKQSPNLIKSKLNESCKFGTGCWSIRSMRKQVTAWKITTFVSVLHMIRLLTCSLMKRGRAYVGSSITTCWKNLLPSNMKPGLRIMAAIPALPSCPIHTVYAYIYIKKIYKKHCSVLTYHSWASMF